MKNGIIALKGGDISNELNITNHHTITPLTDLLNEKQFDKKKIVYVSMTWINLLITWTTSHHSHHEL